MIHRLANTHKVNAVQPDSKDFLTHIIMQSE
jgi:hypothetical protein